MIADSGNWDIGVPALTTSLRGLVRVDVEVRTLTHAVHSGMWGGLVPDALMTLSRADRHACTTTTGNVAVDGPARRAGGRRRLPRGAAARRVRRRRRASSWIGERLDRRAALDQAVAVASSASTRPRSPAPATPSSRPPAARLSLRIAPGDTTANAVAPRCARHLETHVPWGAELTITLVDTGEATQIDATGPAYDAARAAFTEAWDGTEPIDMGVGGSIPFIAEFLDAFPEASVLVTGVEDPDTRAHGANEGLHLAEFERVVLAEALLLQQPRRAVRRVSGSRRRGSTAAARSARAPSRPRRSARRRVRACGSRSSSPTRVLCS